MSNTIRGGNVLPSLPILREADVIDNLTSSDINKPLSANQGIVLKGKSIWNSTVSYVVNEIVQRGGLSFRALQAGINKDPLTETAYWECIPADVGVKRNAIINGGFDIWQRGTSFAAIATGAYSSDMWKYTRNGTMVHTISRDTDTPSGVNSNFSLKIDCTTADVSIHATDYCWVQSYIEGYNFLPFVGKKATLSFWVKSPKTGVHCVAFINKDNDRRYIAEYTVNVINTWEKKSITLKFDYSGGGWNYQENVGLRITWALACGTNFHTTPNVWGTGGYTTSSQVNVADNVANDFYLAQVQLNVGNVALPFEYKGRAEELRACQRYFYRLSATKASVYYAYCYPNNAMTITNGCIDLPVRLRIMPPSVSFSNLKYWNIPGGFLDIAVSSFTISTNTLDELGSIIGFYAGCSGLSSQNSQMICSGSAALSHISFDASF